MTPKITAVISAAAAGFFSFLSWLCTVPPSQQADMLGQLVQIVPESWKPNVGVATRFLTWGLGIYAAMQAAKSGPATPPKTNTVTGELLPTDKPANTNS